MPDFAKCANVVNYSGVDEEIAVFEVKCSTIKLDVITPYSLFVLRQDVFVGINQHGSSQKFLAIVNWYTEPGTFGTG